MIQKMINFDDVTKENNVVMMLYKSIIHIGHKFLIIDKEYYQWEVLHLEKQIHYLI